MTDAIPIKEWQRRTGYSWRSIYRWVKQSPEKIPGLFRRGGQWFVRENPANPAKQLRAA